MKFKLTATAFLMFFLMNAITGISQTKTPRIHHRQEHQQKRIAHGVKSGKLTARETARLEKREAKIQQHKKVAKSDGKVTVAERRKLRREENRTSRAIYRQKHDPPSRH